MKVKKVSNTSEVITHHQLLRGLGDSNYIICPKLPIKDVIDSSLIVDLTKLQRKFIDASHFDFVVTDFYHNPLFAVEFDGPHHLVYEKTIKRDIMKNRICQLAEFPLLRVNDIELEEYDTISILQFIAYRFVKWNQELPKFEKEITGKLQTLTEEEFRDLTEEGFLDPSIDSGFLFDRKFRFPLTNDLQTELRSKFDINFIYPNSSNSLWYYIGTIKDSYDKTYSITKGYGIYQGKSSNLSWNNGQLNAPNIKILVENNITLVLNHTLITDEAYDFDESPINFNRRMGYLPIYQSQLPGAIISDIGDAICEYLCFKKILNWSKQNIKEK